MKSKDFAKLAVKEIRQFCGELSAKYGRALINSAKLIETQIILNLEDENEKKVSQLWQIRVPIEKRMRDINSFYEQAISVYRSVFGDFHPWIAQLMLDSLKI